MTKKKPPKPKSKATPGKTRARRSTGKSPGGEPWDHPAWRQAAALNRVAMSRRDLHFLAAYMDIMRTVIAHEAAIGEPESAASVDAMREIKRTVEAVEAAAPALQALEKSVDRILRAKLGAAVPYVAAHLRGELAPGVLDRVARALDMEGVLQRAVGREPVPTRAKMDGPTKGATLALSLAATEAFGRPMSQSTIERAARERRDSVSFLLGDAVESD